MDIFNDLQYMLFQMIDTHSCCVVFGVIRNHSILTVSFTITSLEQGQFYDCTSENESNL